MDILWNQRLMLKGSKYCVGIGVWNENEEIKIHIQPNTFDGDYLDLDFDDAAKLLETLAEAVEFMASHQAPKEAV